MANQERVRQDNRDNQTQAVHTRLQKLFTIDDPGLIHLRAELREDREHFLKDHTYLAASLSHHPQPPIMVDRIELIGMTSSSRKWQELEFLTRQASIPFSVRDAEETERAIHARRRKDPDFPHDYAKRVAIAKQPTHHTDVATLALDTVITDTRGFPIEKPESIREALQIALSLSGTSFHVDTGISLFTPTQSGYFVSISMLVSIGLQAKILSAREVENYLRAQDMGIYDVPAGIEFSDPLAQQLMLDGDTPITISSDGTWGTRQTMIPFTEISVLDGYFLGAPPDPLSGIFAMIPTIYTHALPVHAD